MFRFADREARVRVIVHELGHAPGLAEHLEESTALMAKTTVAQRGGAPRAPTVTRADLRELRRRCPRLGDGNGRR